MNFWLWLKPIKHKGDALRRLYVLLVFDIITMNEK